MDLSNLVWGDCAYTGRPKTILEARIGPAEALDRLLDSAQETCAYSAIEDAVVEGDRRVHHASDGNRIVNHHGALDDSFHGHKTSLRLVDDRVCHYDAQRAGIIDGDRAAFDFGKGQLACTGLLGQLVTPCGRFLSR